MRPAREDDDDLEAGGRAVGRRRRRRVAGRRADDRPGAALDGLATATTMPRSLNEPVGFWPSTFSVQVRQAELGAEAAQPDERRGALAERERRRRVGHRQEAPVALDEARARAAAGRGRSGSSRRLYVAGRAPARGRRIAGAAVNRAGDVGRQDRGTVGQARGTEPRPGVGQGDPAQDHGRAARDGRRRHVRGGPASDAPRRARRRTSPGPAPRPAARRASPAGAAPAGGSPAHVRADPAGDREEVAEDGARRGAPAGARADERDVARAARPGPRPGS